MNPKDKKLSDKIERQRTPIKKWLNMSPLQDDLAIIESEDSAHSRPELFNQLVGFTPSFQEQNQPSSGSLSDQQEQDQLSSELLVEGSQVQPISVAVNSLEPLEILSSQRQVLRIIDENRRGCNCKNSKCQKNYCDCLRLGLTCVEGVCKCEGCRNTKESQIHRENNKRLAENDRQPAKGCHCRKSRCLKKYCQCHSGGRKCTAACECIQCSNHDQNDDYTNYQSIRKLRKISEKVNQHLLHY